MCLKLFYKFSDQLKSVVLKINLKNQALNRQRTLEKKIAGHELLI